MPRCRRRARRTPSSPSRDGVLVDAGGAAVRHRRLAARRRTRPQARTRWSTPPASTCTRSRATPSTTGSRSSRCDADDAARFDRALEALEGAYRSAPPATAVPDGGPLDRRPHRLTHVAASAAESGDRCSAGERALAQIRQRSRGRRCARARRRREPRSGRRRGRGRPASCSRRGPGPRRSATVMPSVSVPGARRRAAPARRAAPSGRSRRRRRTDRAPAEVEALRVAVGRRRRSRAARRRSAPGRCRRRRCAAATSGVARAWWVTSSPTIVSGHASLKTMCGGLGVDDDVELAVALQLPTCTPPPISTTSRTRGTMRGSMRTASAMLVSAPVGTSVISPGSAAMIVSMMNCDGVARVERDRRLGQHGAVEPATRRGCSSARPRPGARAGARHPRANGTPVMPGDAGDRRARCASPSRCVWLPTTVVTRDQLDLGIARARAAARSRRRGRGRSRG